MKAEASGKSRVVKKAAGVVVTDSPAAATSTKSPEKETTSQQSARLNVGQKAKVGLDEQRRSAPPTKAPRGSVASFLASQVQMARGLDVAKQLASIAASLDVDDVLKTATRMGAGTFGATFDLGNGFVAKHFGDPTCTLGPLVESMPPDAFTDMAKRQVAVHTALHEEGFACVPAAVVDHAPTWVVMQKAGGVAFSELTAPEQEQATAACARVREEIRPATIAAIAKLGFDVGAGFDTDVHVENARFERTPNGVVVSGFFDPTV